MNRLTFVLLCSVFALAGCADSSAIITGIVRPATTPDKVQIYLQPPAVKYDTIGIVTASSKNRAGISRQTKTNKAIQELKIKAAEIGANGVILQNAGSENSSTVGVVSGGVFMAVPQIDVSVSGTAIYVP